jgi:hypothetical protein
VECKRVAYCSHAGDGSGKYIARCATHAAMRCVPLRSLRHCRERSQTQPQLARHLVRRLHRPCIHGGTDICMFPYSHIGCCDRH